MDFKWSSMGGVLLDGSGDIASSSPRESMFDMIRTRLKADLDGWKLYRIGADLASLIGETRDEEMEVTVRRQINNSLANQLMPPGSFTIKTVPLGNEIRAYVYVNQDLVTTVSINTQNASVNLG